VSRNTTGCWSSVNHRNNEQQLAVTHVDEQIQSAKLNYSISIGHTFSTVFPHPEAWYLFYQQSFDRVAYLLGVSE